MNKTSISNKRGMAPFQILDTLGALILVGVIGMGALQEGAVKPAIEFSMEMVVVVLVGIVGWFVRNMIKDMCKDLEKEQEHRRELSKRLGILSDKVSKIQGRMEE